MPCRLKKHPVLGIDKCCFTRRDAKEERIKFINIINKTAPLHARLIEFQPRVTEILPPIPSIRRNFANTILLRNEVLPVFLIITGTWEPARHPNDGYIASGRLPADTSVDELLFNLHEDFNPGYFWDCAATDYEWDV